MLTWLARRAAKQMRLDNLYDRVGSFASPFRGVYDSWAAAQRAIPAGQRVGYNHAEAVSMYTKYLEKIRPSDYAALFWMKSVIEESSSVFDLGGNIGLAYYAFRRYLNYPSNLRWTVCDLPEIVQAGRDLARERNVTGLAFTEDFCDAEGADILLTTGTLQYMQTPLSEILSPLGSKPKHLLVNRTPLYEGDTFHTVQYLPPMSLIYRVFNREVFIDSILALGYELVDSWDIAEPSCGRCVIPFHPDRAIHAYTGLYFKLNLGPTAGGIANVRF